MSASSLPQTQTLINTVLTELGLTFPYLNNASDATISGNSTMTSALQVHRDLTINNGIIYTSFASPQILVCRNLTFGNTSSQISGNGLGASGGTGGGAAGPGGEGALSGSTVLTGTSADVSNAIYDKLLAVGGASVVTAIGSIGGTVKLNPFALLNLIRTMCSGGGGGGAGAGSTAAGAALGGRRGGAGATGGANGGGGGGGSGTGGGGGGGANQTSTATGGTGGAGGGVIFLICNSILNAAGLISANGNNGNQGVTNGGGGGGGGGGAVWVMANTIVVVPTLQVNGGTGASGIGTGFAAGNGGAGVSFLMRAA